ncbi:MAG: hypothetical protein HQM16_15805 [Deltaproteobacteria bacterium]|nr:hypothetical protein [Deltaproteobacteria bacterium]
MGCKIFINLLIVLLISSACAGTPKFTFTDHPQHSFFSSQSSLDKNTRLDKEFKIRDFDKEGLNDKIGYVILGLAVAGITAGLVALPIILARQ